MAQPSPDTVVITMTGVAVAVGSPCQAGLAAMDFDLEQCLEVVLDKDVKAAKLTLEGRETGWKVEFQADLKGKSLPASVETTAYRIVPAGDSEQAARTAKSVLAS